MALKIGFGYPQEASIHNAMSTNSTIIHTSAASPDSPALSLYAHGGNLADIAAQYPDAPTPWLDLSTGVNPYAYTTQALPANAYSRLPERSQLAALYEAASRYFGVPAECIAAFPGSQPLMSLLAALRKETYGPALMASLSPSYSEHVMAWQPWGHSCTHGSHAALLQGRADVTLLCNPNNPTAAITSPDDIRLLTNHQRRSNRWLIVDEAFADTMAEISVASVAASQERVVVIRSFGKFFGLPGLRLSFAITQPSLAELLRRSAGSWPVSTAACIIGAQAMADTAWITEMQKTLLEEAAQWQQALNGHGTIIGACPLFTLLDVQDAQNFAQHMAVQGIHLRQFAALPHAVRLGLPHKDEMARVLAALP